MNDISKITKIYYEDLSRENLLDDAEEQRLSERIMKGDERAAASLASANLRFVAYMARKYQGKGVRVEDLVGEGNMALVEASRRYDASHGNRFVAYAAPYIDKAMRSLIDQQAGIVTTPKNASCEDKLRSRAMSVDAPLGGMENISLLNVLADADSPSPENNVSSIELNDEIKQKLDELNEREREVIMRCFGIGMPKMTMAEAAEKMGLKRERVRQIRKKALRKMS